MEKLEFLGTESMKTAPRFALLNPHNQNPLKMEKLEVLGAESMRTGLRSASLNPHNQNPQNMNTGVPPNSSRGMIFVKLPELVFKVPTSMSVADCKREILNRYRALMVNIDCLVFPNGDEVTIGKKRAMQADFEKHDILKRKKVEGATTENDSSYDTKKNIKKEPHDSKGILPHGTLG